MRCPNGGMRQLMHIGLVGVMWSVLKDVGIPDFAIVTEARNLKSADATRPRDVIVLVCFAEGRHMVIDTAVTTLYRKNAFSQVAAIPGYVAKHAEDRKFYAGRTSHQTIAAVHGGPHVMFPFAVEDCSRLGAHSLAVLKALATVALEKGRQPPHAYLFHKPSTPTLASLWTRRWQKRLSSWLHLAISKHAIRLVCSYIVAHLRYIHLDD